MTSHPSILITGCSSGIGLTVAKGLAQRGWRVFATARDQDDVDVLQAMGFDSLRLDLSDSTGPGGIVVNLNISRDERVALSLGVREPELIDVTPEK